jgi:tetratricopeptide (TPR) repeat protein
LFATKPDYDKAEPFYNKMIALDPKNIQWKIKGYSSLGIIYTKRKKYQIAVNQYKKVLEVDPKNENAQKAIDGLNKAIKAQQEQQ